MNVYIKHIPNILDHRGRTDHVLPHETGKTIDRYMRDLGLDPKEHRAIVSGRVVSSPDKQVLRKEEHAIFTPIVEDPVSIITAIVNFVVAAFTQYLAVTLAVISIGYSIYAYLNRPKAPNFGGSGEGNDENSPTYAWDGMVTTQDPSLPIAIVYGNHPVPGNIINQFIESDGDKSYLYTLLGLCEGEIEEVGDLYVNDQISSNYGGITVDSRVGTSSQSVVSGFEDQHNVITVDRTLTQASNTEYTTIDSDVEGFIVNLQFLGGLFQQNATTGALMTWSVTVKVEYKLTSAGSYTNLGNFSFSHKSRSTFVRQIRKTGLTAGKYDIRITRISADSSDDPVQQGDVKVASIDELKTDDLRYPMTALIGIKALATEQLSGSSPSFRTHLKGRKVSVPYVLISGSTPVDWDDYYWDPDYDSGVGSFRLLSDDTVLTWDGTTYYEAYSANPIWCIKDLLENSRYGVGDYVGSSSVDDVLNVEMAKYCEEKVEDGDGGYEKRFRLDVVIDSKTKALDMITQLASTFRGIVFFSEGRVKVRIDKPEEIVQVFGMGNIVKGNFTQSWQSKREYYNRISIQFANQDTNYRMDTIPWEEEAALSSEPRRERTIRLFTSKLSYARREARYALKVSRLITRSVTLKAATDALFVQPGDLIAVSHDVPQIGFSGRAIAGSTSTTIKLDRTVTIEAATDYAVTVQHADDSIETFDVTNSPGDTDTLTIDGTWNVNPSAYTTKYIFGEALTHYKEYRVVSLRRVNQLEVELTGIEYNENVYDETSIIVPQTNYSVLSNETQDVQNLNLTEMVVKNKDGTLINTIEVWFDKPSLASYYLSTFDRVRVYLSDDGGSTWILWSESKSDHVIIDDNIQTGETYYVAVTSVNKQGQEKPISSSPQDSITILGKQAPPSNVQNFDVSQNGEKLIFTFDAIPDGDLARYIIKKGSEWGTGDIIAERVDATSFEFPVGQTGLQSFMVKAIDTSGNESTSPAIDTLTVVPPPEMNFVNNFDPWSSNLEYKLSNCSLVWTDLFSKRYARPAISLDTDTTWEELEALGKGWEEAEEDGDLVLDNGFVSSGYLEMVQPIDLETVFEFTILVDVDFFNRTGGTLSVEISTSEDGSTYTAFSTVVANTQYRARYIKFRYNLATSDTDYNVLMYAGTIFINAPRVKVAFGSDLAVPSGGVTVEFGVGFSRPPRVKVDIVNGVTGFVKITKTADDMTVRLFEDQAQTTPISSGEIDWEARGI